MDFAWFDILVMVWQWLGKNWPRKSGCQVMAVELCEKFIIEYSECYPYLSWADSWIVELYGICLCSEWDLLSCGLSWISHLPMIIHRTATTTDFSWYAARKNQMNTPVLYVVSVTAVNNSVLGSSPDATVVVKSEAPKGILTYPLKRPSRHGSRRSLYGRGIHSFVYVPPVGRTFTIQ